MAPTSTGLRMPTARPDMMVVDAMRPRTPIGYWSAIRELWTGRVLDLEIPVPSRAKKKTTT